MSVINRIFRRIKQFGGWRLLKGYASLGVLGKVIFAVFPRILCKPYNEVHSNVLRIVAPALKDKYRLVLKCVIERYGTTTASSDKSNFVWVCWLQGMDSAPELVKCCYKSLKHHLGNRVIHVIDSYNLTQYVQLPEFIMAKWRKGQIPPAIFSDIIRIELLIKYGGTWIDSTVFCSGSNYPSEYLDSKLFLFQFTKPGANKFEGISNWFITSSYANNPYLLIIRDMLYEYWRDFDSLVYYFIFHLFFSMLVEEKPKMIKDMPYGYSPNSLFLQRHLDDSFNEENWEKLTLRVPFHKLTYRISDNIKHNKGNFYNKLLEIA